MSHDHHGHHHDNHSISKINKAFVIGIILNTSFLIIEFIVGYQKDSLALISDAGHNATDVFSLLISLVAFKLMHVKANDNYTYGYKKGSILASLLNAILLIITVLVIFYEGISRLQKPVAIPGMDITIVAIIGIFINGFSAWLFFKDQHKDINIKGAYLHMLTDAMVSLGVALSGVIIYYTHWYILDTIISFIVGLIILKATWNLLSDSIRLSLDGMPKNVQLDEVKAIILKCPAISGVHHIHIWPLSSSENALTAHLVLKNNFEDFEKHKADLKHQLLHANVHHITFETEYSDCKDNC